MTPKPPRTAVWLIEFFVPPATAEPAVGDLEEEFVSRVTRSGHRAARRWYRRQALRTTVHLVWGAVRAEPWSTTALVLGSFVAAPLLSGVANVWVARLVSNLPIYDYETSVWSWRVAALVRFVAVPLALGWSIAVVARGREMIITTLVAGALLGMLVLPLALNVRLLLLGPGQRVGLYWVLNYMFEAFLLLLIFPLGILIGGMLRRLQQMRGPARIAE